jgi:hypothetical protein
MNIERYSRCTRSNRVGRTKSLGGVHDAVTFAVTAPVGRERSVGHPTCPRQVLAFRYKR